MLTTRNIQIEEIDYVILKEDNTMNNDYTEVNVQKEKMDISVEPEQVPGPMPVDDSMPIEKPKRRRRRTVVPSLADNGITDTTVKHDEQKPVIVNVDDIKEEDQELKESINRVMDNMREKMGYPIPLEKVVSNQQINAWKQEFGEVYRTDLNGQVYLWHKLRRKDYIDIMSNAEFSNIENSEVKVFLRQEEILRRGALFPNGEALDYIIENNAGVAANISDEIMLASGFRAVRSEKV